MERANRNGAAEGQVPKILIASSAPQMVIPPPRQAHTSHGFDPKNLTISVVE